MQSNDPPGFVFRSPLRLGSLAPPAVCLVTALIVAKNPLVAVLLLTDGVMALAIVGPAILGGFALLPVLRLGPLSLTRQLLFGAGLGLGLLAMLVLLLGLGGVTQRPVWIALLLVSAAVGLARLRGELAARKAAKRGAARRQLTPGSALRPLWMLACPFLAIAILAACVPPGYLWAEEGNGYDVLEYHLEMPKEYLQAGHIHYAPHNVYANFPANVEMLYLLGMILRGDAIDAGGTCKLVNAALAVLIVLTAWMIGRRRSPHAGVVTAVIAAGVGWLTYLSGIAFVENGMILFGMLATAAALEALHSPTQRIRWCILAGLLAGFSAGCKYTAAPLVGLPLAVALLICLRTSFARRAACVTVFILAQAMAFLPWAVKNTAMTGNPVFPLANTLFEAYPDGWGPDQSSHFDAAHEPAPDERGLGPRLATLWRHIPADPEQRFGAVLLILALVAAVASRRCPAVRLTGLMLLVQLPAWLWVTHLYARFAVPLAIPLIVLAGRVPLDSPRWRRGVAALVVAGTFVNLAFTARLYLRHMVPDGKRFGIEGATEFLARGLGLGHEHLETINGQLPEDARILMVGDAKAFYFRRQVDYCVVFNHSPFIEHLRSRPMPEEAVDWLRERGYTHVLANWAEISRLRRSRYGFAEEIHPAMFDSLSKAGLQHMNSVISAGSGRKYADLYRVAKKKGAF